MQSLNNFFVIGPGPSSSHTIGPYRASLAFKDLIKKHKVSHIEVTLYGSLAFTGKGHGTDEIIFRVFKDNDVFVYFDTETETKHPNTFKIIAHLKDGSLVERTYVSIGGGSFEDLNGKPYDPRDHYPFKSFDEIKEYMKKQNYTGLVQIVNEFEPDLTPYLEKVLEIMFKAVKKGISTTGEINASRTLKVKKVAKEMFEKANKIDDKYEKEMLLLSSFAYAVAELNASKDIVVTAPTCGSSGILPAILYYAHYYEGISKDLLIRALKCAGLVGNLFKQNASVSGAVHGCQAEIGVATAMGAVALSSIHNLSIYALEYAAEVAIEHTLGLTCDPVDGYVVIPCVERNGVYVLRAVDAFLYAKHVSGLRKNRVSLDNIIEIMKITGDAIHPYYRETSQGGLAKIIKD